IYGRFDPVVEVAKDGVARAVARDDVQAILPAQSLGIEATLLEGRQHAVVGRLVADKYPDLVAFQARHQEARRRRELLLRLPEIGDVISQRHERAPDAERQTGLTARVRARSSAPEELEHALLVGGEIRWRLLPESLERVHHEAHLGEVGPAARTTATVRLEAI